MAKNLTYIANHDGNRKWLLDRFDDEAKPKTEYIYLCQLRDSNANSHDIVIIPREDWPKIIEEINKALEEFK